MTLNQKIGQMLCLGWQGDGALGAVNEQARRCVTELHAGGMILFARNVRRGDAPTDVARAREMLTELQGLAEIPLLIAVDQEGGHVARFGAPFTPFPSAKIVGVAGDLALARQAARVTATELRAVGVNLNFAPVADINSNAKNPVIGDRAFGDNALTVTPFVMAQVQGYADGGVLACAKHFPGHGDTDVDSHLALPLLNHDVETLFHREAMPFMGAIRAGVPAVMTAHILFPALDPSGVPATMSRVILTEMLREQFAFRGLIVTDCLQMKAVADTWGTPRAAVMAAQAGADILLVCHDWKEQKATFDALVAAVESGELSEARIDQSVGRILSAKAQLPAEVPPLSVIGSPAHLAVARAICEKAGVAFAEPTPAPTLGERSF